MYKLILCVLVGLAVVTVASPAPANLAISTAPSNWQPMYKLAGVPMHTEELSRCKVWTDQSGSKLTVLVHTTGGLTPAPAGFGHLGDHVQIDFTSGATAPVYTVIVTTSGARIARVEPTGPVYLSDDIVSCIKSSDQTGNYFETTVNLTSLGILITEDNYLLLDVGKVTSESVVTLSTNPPLHNPLQFVTVRRVTPYKTLSDLFSEGVGAGGITRFVIVHSEEGWGYSEDPITLAGTKYVYTGAKLPECSYVTAEVTVRDWKSVQITRITNTVPYSYPKRVQLQTGLMRQSIANAADPTGLYAQVVARVSFNVMDDGSGPVVAIGYVPDGLFKLVGVVGNGYFYVKGFELL